MDREEIRRRASEYPSEKVDSIISLLEEIKELFVQINDSSNKILIPTSVSIQILNRILSDSENLVMALRGQCLSENKDMESILSLPMNNYDIYG